MKLILGILFIALIFVGGCLNVPAEPIIEESAVLKGVNCGAGNMCPENYECVLVHGANPATEFRQPICVKQPFNQFIKCPLGSQMAIAQSYPQQISCKY